jgi:hypothetical protein
MACRVRRDQVRQNPRIPRRLGNHVRLQARSASKQTPTTSAGATNEESVRLEQKTLHPHNSSPMQPANAISIDKKKMCSR